MKSLIIGNGQVGSALFDIFSKVHECYVRDVEHVDFDGIEILHITYPYSEDFIGQTRRYIETYRPKLTMIHSSVAIGTTEMCGQHVVHSPERGRFPNLAYEMKRFPKFVGGISHLDVGMAVRYIEACEWPTVAVFNPRWTEAIKLFSNIHLGLEIAWRQEVDRILKIFGGETEAGRAYDLWEDSYNNGLRTLGQQNLVRPRLSPGPIGGHCILPCTDILLSQYPSLVFRFIKESNEKRKSEEIDSRLVGNGHN